MLNYPVRHIRPTKQFDGEGSALQLTEVGVLWSDITIQDNSPRLVVHAAEDVRIGDLIEVPHNLILNS